MSKVGSWGKDIVFSVDDKKVFTPSTFERSGSARWAIHEIISGKPKSEFLGPGIDQIQMDITLDIKLGVKPKKMIDKLKKAKDTGKVNALIIGTAKIGNYKWYIESLSDKWETVYSKGQLAKAKVSLTFKEYNR